MACAMHVINLIAGNLRIWRISKPLFSRTVNRQIKHDVANIWYNKPNNSLAQLWYFVQIKILITWRWKLKFNRKLVDFSTCTRTILQISKNKEKRVFCITFYLFTTSSSSPHSRRFRYSVTSYFNHPIQLSNYTTGLPSSVSCVVHLSWQNTQFERVEPLF